jgi:hypothetical protein
MAFEKGIATVTLEVQAAPGAFLSADPSSLKVDRGDLAVYHLTVSPLNGFAGPIFLRAVNLSHVEPEPADPSENAHHFSPNPVPAGGGQATLTIETDGWDISVFPSIEIGIEAVDVLPDGEYPVL